MGTTRGRFDASLPALQLRVFLEHGGGWVDVQPTLITQVAKIAVDDVAFLAVIQVLENLQRVFRTQLSVQSLETHHEAVNRDLAVPSSIKEAESLAECAVALLDSPPDHLHGPLQTTPLT